MTQKTYVKKHLKKLLHAKTKKGRKKEASKVKHAIGWILDTQEDLLCENARLQKEPEAPLFIVSTGTGETLAIHAGSAYEAEMVIKACLPEYQGTDLAAAKTGCLGFGVYRIPSGPDGKGVATP